VPEAALDLRAALLNLVRALAEEHVEDAFIGALPVLAWGRVRATTDIDLVVVVTETDWQRLLDCLARRGIRQRRQVGPTDPTDAVPDIAVLCSANEPVVRIDLYVAKTDFERAVVASSRCASVLGETLRLARPEASIIYKLLAHGPRDLDDVEGIFVARQLAGEPLDWAFLDEWAQAWGIDERLVLYRTRYGPG
jgi:hypothetical protein